MTEPRAASAGRNDLETLFQSGSFVGRDDAELLGRYLEGGTAAGPAFEVLVERHGPLVWRVCRAALGDPNDAQDAFQATFLVLVRQAKSVRKRGSVASWLFGVASRVAARARSDAARRRKHEQRGAAMTPNQMSSHKQESDINELAPLLHEEVGRLPERYRAPVVLCDLEGRSYEDAARALGCPLGTLKTRLSRARSRLRDRLTRRGLSLPAGLVAVTAGLAAKEAVAAAVPPALARATVRAALLYGTKSSAAVLAAGGVSARAVAWTDGVISAMWLSTLKLTAAGALILGAGLTGATLFATTGQSPGPAAALPNPAPGRTAPDIASEALRNAMTFAESITDPAERAEVLLRLGRAQAFNRENERARATLVQAAKAATAIPANASYRSPHPIIRIAEAQAEVGDRDAAARTFTRAAAKVAAEDPDHQERNWLVLLSRQLRVMGLAASGTSVELYRQYLDERGDKIEPTTRAEAMIRVQAEARDFEGALRMIHEEKLFNGPNALPARKQALLSIVYLIRPDDRNAAGPVLAEARKVVDSAAVGNGRWSHSYDLSVIAKALARIGRFEEAIATNREGPTDGMPEDAAQEASVFKGLAFVFIAREQLKSGDKEAAGATGRMAVDVIRARRRRTELDPVFWFAAGVLSKAGRFAEALQVAEEITSSARRDNVLESIGYEQSAVGQGDAARATIRRALSGYQTELRDGFNGKARAVLPRDLKHAALGIARIHAHLGDLAAAITFIDALPTPSERVETLRDLAASQASVGNLATARDLVLRIADPKARGSAWIAVACAAAETEPERGAPGR